MHPAVDMSGDGERVYRVDKFVVPESARDEFMTNVQEVHQLLREQPGFAYDLLLEKTSGQGTFNIVTLVAWESTDAVAEAGAAVRKMHERTGFVPRELFGRLGITADRADYSEIS